MRNQFFYTDKIQMPGVKEDTENGITAVDPYIQEKRNSFNVDMVIRTISMDNGELLVLLDDIHERTQEVRKLKNKKPVVVKEKNTYQSEIYLSKEDSERFFNLTNIENGKTK